MIQRHKILLKLTGDTKDINSSMQNINNYEVNNSEGLGLGIVNESNVRAFLNDDSNEVIIRDFFSYLTASTTTVEFSEIFYSDKKLSNVFTEYYNSRILSNQFPSPSVINENLTGTSGTTIIRNDIFNYDGVAPQKGLDKIPLSIDNSTRDLKIYSALTTYTTEDSYYIPVFIKRNYSVTDRERVYFDEIEKILEDFTPVIDSPPEQRPPSPYISPYNDIIIPIDVVDLNMNNISRTTGEDNNEEIIETDLIVVTGITTISRNI